MLFVITGARGAGKTTLLRKLKEDGRLVVLQPSTTRQKRSDDYDDEYEFGANLGSSGFAWKIPAVMPAYGLRNSEIKKARKDDCITVFDPLHWATFEQWRRNCDIDVLTVGLDTLANLSELAGRVGDDERRMMSQSEFDSTRDVVKGCDVTLKGDAKTVLDAVCAVLHLWRRRGGHVGASHLKPLMRAGVLIENFNVTNIKGASYDLTLGSEVFSGGKLSSLERGGIYEIRPYSYSVVTAAERADLPTFIAGTFDLKVSLFLRGGILSNGPQIDPGYKGQLFCLLFNASEAPIRLAVGEHFATIVFTTTCSISEPPYRDQYQLKDKLAQVVDLGAAASGPGGDIIAYIERTIAASLENFKMVQYLGATLIVGAVAVWGWLGMSLNDMLEKKAEVNSLINELQERVADLDRSRVPGVDVAKDSGAITIDAVDASADAILSQDPLSTKDASSNNGAQSLPGAATAEPPKK